MCIVHSHPAGWLRHLIQTVGNNTMKTAIQIIFIILLFSSSALNAQSKYGTTDEEIETCKQYLSLYREYVYQKMYLDAYEFWQKADNTCPLAAENHYPYGRQIVLELLNNEDNKKRRKELINRLKKIYEDWLKITDNPSEIMDFKDSDFEKINK